MGAGVLKIDMKAQTMVNFWGETQRKGIVEALATAAEQHLCLDDLTHKLLM